MNILSMEYSVFRNIGQIKCNFAFEKFSFDLGLRRVFRIRSCVLNYILCFEATVVCSLVALNQRDGDTLLNRNGVISHASPTTVFI